MWCEWECCLPVALGAHLSSGEQTRCSDRTGLSVAVGAHRRDGRSSIVSTIDTNDSQIVVDNIIGMVSG